ncbi:MAG TPA: hypothetical protein VMR89_02720 [Actinomycetota bacterium]|nr:hypothetical protein [Actinomycetota bacterium]
MSDQAPTSTSTEVARPTSTETTVRQLVRAAAGLRDESNMLSDDAKDLHRRALLHNLDTRTAPHAQRAVTELLEALSGYGFAWSAIARMVGVSVPALRKWRNGETPTGPNRRRLAQLLAMVEFLAKDYLVDDPASWMEVPISSEAPISPGDLYALDRTDLVLDWASHRMEATAVLDESMPDWRERYASDFEVSRWHDGQLVTRPRER